MKMRETTIEEIEQLKSEGKKFLLDFSGSWCSGCLNLKPKLEQISKDYTNVDFIYVDVDKHREYAINLGVKSLPTIMVYNGNELIDRSTGALDYSYYMNVLNGL
jgi:thioredoxin 1